MRWTIGAFSDLHAGSSVGLHGRAVTTLDDGGSYAPSKVQRWLHDKWDDYRDKLDNERGDKLALALVGDAMDGDHHGTWQLASGNPVDQAAILDAVMAPMFELKPDLVIVIRGTEAHVGQSGSHEEGIARVWRDRGIPILSNENTASWWHFVGEFEGVVVDLAHHGNMGGRSWTGPNAANLHAADIFMSYAKRRQRHPDLVLRAHSHNSADSHDAHPVRYIAMPCWQLKTAYGHKVASTKFPDIGGVIAQCEDGHLEARRVRYPLDPSPIWKSA